MRNDYHVRPARTEIQIKEIAIKLRVRLGVIDIPDFSISRCVERFAGENILKSGPIAVILFKGSSDDPPAFVTFSPRKTLNIEHDVSEDAKYNIPWVRKVLAHEFGHLVLHSHYVHGFSGTSSEAWPKEESSEWQADRFCDHFLVSDAEIDKYSSPNSIANHCAVELDVALRRLGPCFTYTKECCRKCGLFTMVNKRLFLQCDNCGDKVF
jgi:hypothetical protein